MQYYGGGLNKSTGMSLHQIQEDIEDDEWDEVSKENDDWIE
jgi:hypothetical protein